MKGAEDGARILASVENVFVQSEAEVRARRGRMQEELGRLEEEARSARKEFQSTWRRLKKEEEKLKSALATLAKEGSQSDTAKYKKNQLEIEKRQEKVRETSGLARQQWDEYERVHLHNSVQLREKLGEQMKIEVARHRYEARAVMDHLSQLGDVTLQAQQSCAVSMQTAQRAEFELSLDTFNFARSCNIEEKASSPVWDGDAATSATPNACYSVFGQPLPERPSPDSSVPPVLSYLCNAVIQLNGQQTEGIFRISAAASAMQRTRALLDSGVLSLGENPSPHLAAGMLKLYLRSLPLPLIPFEVYRDLFLTESKPTPPEYNIDFIRAKCPPSHADVILYVLTYLRRHFLTDEVVERTKMGLDNICTVFTPAFVRPPDGLPPDVILSSQAKERKLVADLLQSIQN
mmetsp:Transcript_42737/g.110155  ORF Transcript_42737/g.110155 Transcript_42737/m.110155 type:complete len:405 (-) Transcript_42737:745-1959(-)